MEVYDSYKTKGDCQNISPLRSSGNSGSEDIKSRSSSTSTVRSLEVAPRTPDDLKPAFDVQIDPVHLPNIGKSPMEPYYKKTQKVS